MTDTSILDSAPAIFNFHVTKFRQLETSEDIALFEDLLRNKARISDFDFSPENLRGQACISECSGWIDECDELK